MVFRGLKILNDLNDIHDNDNSTEKISKHYSLFINGLK